MVATLTGSFHVSRRDAERFLEENLGMKVSLGTISNTEAVVSAALASAHAEAHEHVRRAPVKNVDETGHAGPEGKTAWVASTPQATCIKVGLDRSRASLEGFIDVSVGVIGSDRYAVYNSVEPGRRQLCWAHIVRAFQLLVDDGGEHARVGKMLLSTAREVLHGWNEYRRRRKRRDEIEALIRRSRANLNWLFTSRCRAGSGNIMAKGTVQSLTMSVAGAGNIDGAGLTASTATVSVAGSGNATATVNGPAVVSSLGSGNVTLGAGAVCTTSKMGSGEVHCG